MALLRFVLIKALTISMIYAKTTHYLKALVQLLNGRNLFRLGECLKATYIQADASLQLRFAVLGQPVGLVPILELKVNRLANHDLARHRYRGELRFEANAFGLH